MSHINDYLDAAIKVQDLPSDRQLALRLDEPTTTICSWRKGRGLPRHDETMRRLAELAHKDVEQALIDLGEWRAVRAKDMATASVYATMRKHLQQARHATATFMVGALLFMAGFSADMAPVEASQDMRTNRLQADKQGSQPINYWIISTPSVDISMT